MHVPPKICLIFYNMTIDHGIIKIAKLGCLKTTLKIKLRILPVSRTILLSVVNSFILSQRK